MSQEVDVFERYYSFDKLNPNNPFYDKKKDNYLLAKKAYFSNQSHIKALPLRTTIQTTDFCNLQCIMCQIHSQREKHSLQQMSMSCFDKIVEKFFPTLIEAHPTNIGEPLLSPWFDYLCEKCQEYGVLLDITTNGTLLTNEKILKILPNLLDIKISFDGLKKKTYEQVRQGACYDKVIQNIENLVNLRNQCGSKGTITLQMTLFDFNYKELPELILFAKEKGIDKIKAYHVFSYSEEMDKHSLLNTPEQYDEIRMQSIALAKEIGLDIALAEPLSKSPNNDIHKLVHQKCRLPWAETFIDYDGNVYPCHSHNHLALGNILTQDSFDIWNGKYTMFLRERLINDNVENIICNKCGNCYIRTDRESAVPYNKDDYLFYKTGDKNINWGKRCKQFQLNR